MLSAHSNKSRVALLNIACQSKWTGPFPSYRLQASSSLLHVGIQVLVQVSLRHYASTTALTAIGACNSAQLTVVNQ